MNRLENSVHRFEILLCILLLGITWGTGVTAVSAASDGWQPVPVSPWVQVSIPPGWTITGGLNQTADPNMVTLSATSPLGTTDLEYIIQKNSGTASAGDLVRAQDQYLGKKGFCTCQSDGPLVSGDGKNITVQQTYTPDTQGGAVAGSGVYPGWGQYQFALIMHDGLAVWDNYDRMPGRLASHIIPVYGDINMTPE